MGLGAYVNKVGFPGLRPEPFTINRVAFYIGGKAIFWYGIIIATGLICGIIYCILEARMVKVKLITMLDLICIQIISAVIGARLYFVLFNLHYFSSVADAFKIWEGGIAIYGAIIGGGLATWVYCKIKKVPIMKILDIAVVALILGQAIGRWGNFVNVEAYGGITELPWRMEVYDFLGRVKEAVHPTFLYESLWCIIGFVVLLFYKKKKKFEGELFLIYGIWYSFGRFWIEGLRQDSLPYNADFKISQILSLIIFISFIAVEFSRRRKLQKD